MKVRAFRGGWFSERAWFAMSTPPSARRPHGKFAPATALAVAALICTLPRPALACRVELAGADSAAWRAAAAALELAADDCARVDVAVGESGARLTFTTRDGRSAERTLVDPAELGSTVAALRVTVPEPPPSAPESSKEAPAARATMPAREPTTAPDALEPESSDAGAIFALSSGTRGGGNALFSPVLGASASLMLDRWELGVTGAFEFQYFDLASHSAADRRSSAVALGVMVGRREPISGFALLYGARLSVVALLHEDRDHGQAEGRAGAFAGVALPRTGGVRFRADLGADVVGAHPGFSEETPVGESRGPITPEWAVTGLIGVEIGGP
jgi:hypothetical protein